MSKQKPDVANAFRLRRKLREAEHREAEGVLREFFPNAKGTAAFGSSEAGPPEAESK